jgi:hypothetical protein
MQRGRGGFQSFQYFIVEMVYLGEIIGTDMRLKKLEEVDA